MRFRWFILAFALISSTACQPSSAQLVDKAEHEALSQKSQLARHLFEHVIANHSTKDSTRFRALKGLSVLALTQLRDYVLAVRIVEKMNEEFGSSISYQRELRDLRFLVAEAARLQLQKPEIALKLISPYIESTDLSGTELRELGRLHTTLLEFKLANDFFSRLWKTAIETRNCNAARENQLDMMQVKTLMKQCPETIEIGKQPLFATCEPDTYSIRLEMAHCYEYEGAPEKAISIFKEMLKGNPENSRIQALLQNVQRREKERLLK